MQPGLTHTVQLTTGPLLASKDVENFFDNLDSRTAYSEATSRKESNLRPWTNGLAGYRAPGSADSLTGSSSRDSTSSSNDTSNVKSDNSTLSDFCSEVHAINSDVGFSSGLQFFSGAQKGQLTDNKMYQGGLALPPSATGYGQDPMANGYLHSGTSPVYVPSTRAMLPVQYMGTPTQNMGTPTTSSHLWTSPNDVTAYTPANTLHSSAAYPFNTTASQGTGRNDAAAGFASPLGRHGGMGGYPTYMGAELSPWNTFNNLALQQGFRPTTGP
ncbi:unnamed protein product, partial [Candidula unifasciata]